MAAASSPDVTGGQGEPASCPQMVTLGIAYGVLRCLSYSGPSRRTRFVNNEPTWPNSSSGLGRRGSRKHQSYRLVVFKCQQ